MVRSCNILKVLAVSWLSVSAFAFPAQAETRPISMPFVYPDALLERPKNEIDAYIDFKSGMETCELFAATGNPFTTIRPEIFSEREADFGDNILIDAEYKFADGQDNIIASFGYNTWSQSRTTCYGTVKMSEEMETEIWEWSAEALTRISTASYAKPDSLQMYSNYAELHFCEKTPYTGVFKETTITLGRLDGAEGEYGVTFGVTMWQLPDHPFCDTGIVR